MPTPGSRLEAQLLTRAEDLQALQPHWELLWREDPRATPFHAPQWLLPWWRHIGEGRLLSVAVRDGQGALVGLAPLYVYTHPATQQRHLFPIGMGTTDYLGPIARPGLHLGVAQAVLGQVSALHDDWDVFECPQLRADDALRAAATAHGAQVQAGEPHPVLSPLDAIPRSTLANLRTCRNRAARAGTLAFQLAGNDDIPELLAALRRLHARRWEQRGLPGVLADEAVQAAHGEAAPLLHAAGLLRLHALRLGDEVIAVLYALQHAGRCCYYIGGFDPAHAAFSPGSLLLAHAIAHAQAEGATAFDFLRGAEPYKYRWGAVDQPMFSARLERRATLHPA